MNWQVYQLDIKSKQGEHENVVVTVYWTCSSQDGSFVYDSSTALEVSDSFTNYNDLTEEQVLSWVWQIIDKDAIERMLTEEIERYKNPAIVKTHLPWQ